MDEELNSVSEKTIPDTAMHDKTHILKKKNSSSSSLCHINLILLSKIMQSL